MKRKNNEIRYRIYRNVNEALEELKKINPADLTSDETTLAEAIRFCREVMTVLVGCDELQFTEEQQRELSEQLKALGCVTYDAANKKYKSSASFKRTIGTPGSIEYPLSAFSQLIDTDRGTFLTGMDLITDGGMSGDGWTGRWLKAQKRSFFEILSSAVRERE